MSGDRYADWDAAYVLGSLSPADRHEYEAHLASCPECTAAVSSIAGLSGLLSMVPTDDAHALLDARPPASSTLQPLLDRARRHQRRARWTVAVLVATAAAMSALLTLAVPRLSWFGEPTVPLAQTVPSPITADIHLADGPHGTRIEGTCRYTATPDGRTFDYALYVTDRSGTSTRSASWSSGPGSELEFTAVTVVRRDQIAAVDIRVLGHSIGKEHDVVLLEATF